MKIVEPKVELWSEENISPESHIARCAHVCYGKEAKLPDQETDKKMVDGLIKRRHLSMLRHSSVYYSFPCEDDIPEELKSEYVNKVIAENEEAYISTNKQFLRERVPVEYFGYSPSEFLEECQRRPEIFSIFRLTFCITTQDAIAKELNRKSPNAIAEKSTRYCNFKDGIEICKPWWWTAQTGNLSVLDIMCLPAKENIAAFTWRFAEDGYIGLLDNGMKPEDARYVLPKALATKVIYTYSVREWEDILALRLYDKTGPAHPDCHIVMAMVRDQINEFAKAHHIDYQV